jgi:hypothetical protein
VEIDSDVLRTPISNVLPVKAETFLKSSGIVSIPSTECTDASSTCPTVSEARQNPSFHLLRLCLVKSNRTLNSYL